MKNSGENEAITALSACCRALEVEAKKSRLLLPHLERDYEADTGLF